MVYALNLVDLGCTLWAVSHGAVEMNPLMRCIPVMIVYKIVVVGVLCAVLRSLAVGGCAAARHGLRLCAAVYGALDVGHVLCLVAAL